MGDISLSNYDINKYMMQSYEPLSLDEIDKLFEENLIKWFTNQRQVRYYCLLCRELNSFTVFALKPKSYDVHFFVALINCLLSFGGVLSLEITEDNSAIEIWIRDKETQENYCYYLFNYNEGVIEIE